MSDDAKNDMVSRRGFLGMGSAALAAAGMMSAADAAGQEQKPYPAKDGRSASAPGPGNPPLDAQNPDSFFPPPSDAGSVQTFKYPFGLGHKRMQEGGWSREVTVRELAISKTIAGVDKMCIRDRYWRIPKTALGGRSTGQRPSGWTAGYLLLVQRPGSDLAYDRL